MENTNLHLAKVAKNDEFYTQYNDIFDELKHYEESFEGKTVLCNCDDSEFSNFTRYFMKSFHALKLKRLICTFFDKSYNNLAYAFIYDGRDFNGDGKITQADIDFVRKYSIGHNRMVDDEGFDRHNPAESNKKGLYGSGDFRSANAIQFLKMADIVVTNPPFSLFREYVAQLMEYNKKFLIIGNMNAITYKEIFPYIMENKLWLGMNHISEFIQPDGNKKKFGNILWFTNLPNKKRTEPMELWKEYNPEVYPKYDNYDAINVDKTYMIPKDYDGVMGVPISFLDKYCPTQFKIVDARTIALKDKLKDKTTYLIKDGDSSINGNPIYARIAIQRIS